MMLGGSSRDSVVLNRTWEENIPEICSRESRSIGTGDHLTPQTCEIWMMLGGSSRDSVVLFSISHMFAVSNDHLYLCFVIINNVHSKTTIYSLLFLSSTLAKQPESCDSSNRTWDVCGVKWSPVPMLRDSRLHISGIFSSQVRLELSHVHSKTTIYSLLFLSSTLAKQPESCDSSNRTWEENYISPV
jgi:hypothetical protein